MNDENQSVSRSDYLKSLYLTNLVLRGDIRADTTVINEFSNMHCGARSDLALVYRNSIEAIEIKSSKDSLSRLERQIAAYSIHFNRVTIVTERNHLNKILNMCKNTSTGVVLYDGEHFVTKKKSKKININKDTINHSLIPAYLKNRVSSISESQYISYVQEKYIENLNIVRNIIENKCASIDDVLELNPSFRRRKRNVFREKVLKSMWVELADNLKIHPFILSEGSDRSIN